MQTGSIKAGDILHLEVRGYPFFARATSRAMKLGTRRGIAIEPLKDNQNIITQFVTARQIVGHYSKRKGSR